MKGKKAVAVLHDPKDEGTAERLAAALCRRYPDFDFTHDVVPAVGTQGAQLPVVRTVLADGPWHVKANLRPSLDQIMRFAEGYLRCLLDEQSAAKAQLEAHARIEAQLAEEEP